MHTLLPFVSLTSGPWIDVKTLQFPKYYVEAKKYYVEANLSVNIDHNNNLMR